VAGVSLDLNGDGLIDVAAGDGRTVEVFYGGRLTEPSQSITAPMGVRSFSFFVTAAGDPNGDGFGDLLVSAPEATVAEGGSVGIAWIFAGGQAGVGALPLQELRGTTQPNRFFGQSAAAAGDVNGDGFGDLWVVENPWFDGIEGIPAVKLFEGRREGAAPNATRELLGDQSDNFGRDLVGGCDVNGDGRPDLIVGGSSLPSDGRLALFVSSASGLPTSPQWIEGASLPGAAPSLAFGATLRVGDVNGDGYADVATRHRTDVATLFGAAGGVNAALARRAAVSQADPGFWGAIVTIAGRTGDGKDELIASGSISSPAGHEGFSIVSHTVSQLVASPTAVPSRPLLPCRNHSLVAVDDATADGIDDLVGSRSTAAGAAEVWLWQHHHTGTPMPTLLRLPVTFRAANQCVVLAGR
jgi:hypothetical protein